MEAWCRCRVTKRTMRDETVRLRYDKRFACDTINDSIAFLEITIKVWYGGVFHSYSPIHTGRFSVCDLYNNSLQELLLIVVRRFRTCDLYIANRWYGKIVTCRSVLRSPFMIASYCHCWFTYIIADCIGWRKVGGSAVTLSSIVAVRWFNLKMKKM